MHNQRGHSLVELVIASAIGVVVLTQALDLFAHRVAAQTHHQGQLRLEQEVRAIIAVVENEVSRHAYWNSADQTHNPHAQWIARSDCLIVSHDRNRDGSTSVDSGERSGIRFREQRVQWRSNATDCDSGRWEALNEDSTVVIDEWRFVFVADGDCTNLSHTPPSSCNPTICPYDQFRRGDKLRKHYRVGIDIDAHLRANPNTKIQIQHQIHLHNPLVEISSTDGPSQGEEHACN
ncbi:MAG: prepilin-type N-terminal cleavage/methylation domain-containing protein [Gammaproteobacteria bacterium]|nr:prepilin-type N-terminal cleavage/methylation domain-containing protein [Gammaproteobacteria bacterium]